MNAELSDLDRRLLDAVQRAVPLVPRPYEQLAAELGAAAAEVVARIAALSGPEGIIREIAGVFDAAALGYASTLVAARCPPGRLDEAGRVLSAHPGVSHCYGRAGELNLWFTLVVGADSRLGLARTVKLLGGRIGAERILSLPALRRYKLDARFDVSGGPGASESPARVPMTPRPVRRDEAGVAGSTPPTADQIRAIRALQLPLPATPEPFAEIARGEQMSADDLLVEAPDFLAAGWMRRYAAVLRHRQAGAAANALVAWAVPADKADAFAARAAQFSAVSHCYLRRAGAGWAYSLYTMIHGISAEEVGRTIDAISAAGGEFPHVDLPTTREYKKAAVRLFSPAFARWEAEAGA